MIILVNNLIINSGLRLAATKYVYTEIKTDIEEVYFKFIQNNSNTDLNFFIYDDVKQLLLSKEYRYFINNNSELEIELTGVIHGSDEERDMKLLAFLTMIEGKFILREMQRRNI